MDIYIYIDCALDKHLVSCRLRAKDIALRLNKPAYSSVKKGQEQGLSPQSFNCACDAPTWPQEHTSRARALAATKATFGLQRSR